MLCTIFSWLNLMVIQLMLACAQHWFKNEWTLVSIFFSRIIESNLHGALSVIVEDLEAIKAYYDEHACLRQKDCVQDLLENVRYLDEQDQEGLHSFLLFQNNHHRSTTSFDENSEEIVSTTNATNGNKIQSNSDSCNSLPDLTDAGLVDQSVEEVRSWFIKEFCFIRFLVFLHKVYSQF